MTTIEVVGLLVGAALCVVGVVCCCSVGVRLIKNRMVNAREIDERPPGAQTGAPVPAYIRERLDNQQRQLDGLKAQITGIADFVGIQVDENEYDTKPIDPSELF
jgi:hypothetical protein